MKKNFTLLTIITVVGILLLTGCRPSDEKLSEVETAKSLMLEAQKSAKETYLDITDSSMEATLNELDEKAAEIEAIDFTKYSDKKIDEILPTITEITTEYQDLQSGFKTTYEAEQQDREEAAKTVELGAYLVNKTGMRLMEVTLHDVTNNTYSDNLLGDGVTLEAGYILMGVVLDINSDSSEWEFIVKNDSNTSYTLSCDSLKGASEQGVSVTLKYDSNSQSGSAVVGNYAALESVDETTSESSSEASSKE